LLLTFIVLVASFSIITNLIMVVLEKGREISSLKTMGATHRSILQVFLYAGIYIGVIGMSVGILTGIWICLFLGYVGLPIDPEMYYISVLPVNMSVTDILLIALASVSLSFLATIYPSLMAARLTPVEGLRHYEE
jgi:lipoprotein-releasing system permease protein